MDRERRLFGVLGIGATLFFAELGTALFSRSLALLADAGHLFLDTLALVLAFLGAKVSGRKPDQHYTYGYHRAEVLAAMANAFLLFVLVGFIVHEAIKRFLAPSPVLSMPVLVMALVGLAGNILMGLLLFRHEKEDLNMRAAFLHVLGDALGSLVVLGAGLTLIFSGPLWVDALASLLIAVTVVFGALRILRKALRILAEAVPEGISFWEVSAVLSSVPGVKGVHDLHVWSLKPGFLALTAHLVLGDELSLRDADQLAEEIRERLRKRFGIEHVTIQFEAQECGGPHCNKRVG